jgi:hypothetical protein
VNGVQLNKPLVEKPIDAEDHNIHIYYPVSAGGGCKHLFRKVNDRSSEFFPDEHDIRRDGSYIYEEFVVTQGTDVKVYTVGMDYAHAEARKSPVVDGKVQRSDGKEVRYPVILTPNEKDMARKIVTAFKQTVCGFDILRVHGKSYCCDVNGFSFVKNSRKYYEDAAKILAEIMINAVRADAAADSPFYSTRAPLLRKVPLSNHSSSNGSPHVSNSGSRKFTSASTTIPENSELSYTPLTSSNKHLAPDSSTHPREYERSGSPAPSLISESEFSVITGVSSRRYELEELRCVIAVIRHGDRTPKQKIKVVITHPSYLSYYHKYSKGPKKDLKLKSKSGLLEFLKVTNEVISERNSLPFDVKRRLIQIKDVLERWEISGINRKLQMKPQKWDEMIPEGNEESLLVVDGEGGSKKENVGGTGLATEILMILKWGGDLTPLGREQAEHLGTSFRIQNYPDNNDGGVLRLHATYRHDLKIKASDEGRVMKTAAAFAKGLLELEGNLTPILASLVTIEEKNRLMLDRGGNFEVKEETDRCKEHLNLLQVDEEINEELIYKVAPDCSQAMKSAFVRIGNPLKCLKRIHYLIERLTSQLEMLIKEYNSESDDGEDDICGPLVIAVEGQGNDITEGIEDVKILTVEGQQGIPIVADSENFPVADVSKKEDDVVVPPPPTPINEEDDENVEDAKITLSPDNNSENLLPSQRQAQQEQLQHSDRHRHHHQQSSSTSSSSSSSASSNITPVGSTMSVITSQEGLSNSSGGSSDYSQEYPSPPKLYNSETFTLMLERWLKLYKDFYNDKKSNIFDLTKVPDVYDMIRYDILHNSHLQLSGMEELYRLSSNFESIVVPQEYGIDREDKRYIGSKMCGALLDKIKSDLIISANNYTLSNHTPENTPCATSLKTKKSFHNDNSFLVAAATENLTSDKKQPVSSNIIDSNISGSCDNKDSQSGKLNPLAGEEGTTENGNATTINEDGTSLSSRQNSGKDENSMLYKLDSSHAEDLQINSLGRCVRTRLYFTSESHLHTILNVFRYPKLDSQHSLSKESLEILNNIMNVSYLSQFVIRLFEDRKDPNKYHCELSFSSGVTDDPINDKSNSLTPYITLSKSMDLRELIGCLGDSVDLYHSDTRLEMVKELSHSKLAMLNGGNGRGELASSSFNPEEEQQEEQDRFDRKKSEGNSGDLQPEHVERDEDHEGRDDFSPSPSFNSPEGKTLRKSNTFEIPLKLRREVSYDEYQLRKSDPQFSSVYNSGNKKSTTPQPHHIKRSNSYTVQMDDLGNAGDLWERENAGLRVTDKDHHHHHHHHNHNHHHRDGRDPSRTRSMAILPSQISPAPSRSTDEKDLKKSSSKALEDVDEE